MCWVCTEDGGDKELLHNFDGETSLKQQIGKLRRIWQDNNIEMTLREVALVLGALNFRDLLPESKLVSYQLVIGSSFNS